MTASLWVGLHVQVGGLTANRTALAGLYFAGGLLPFPSLFAVRLVSLKRSAEIRFAASFVCLTVITIAMTSALLALIFWNFQAHFQAQWYGESWTSAWLVHFAYSGASALYQFAVVGTRLYLPTGIVALFATSIWLAYRTR